MDSNSGVVKESSVGDVDSVESVANNSVESVAENEG
jgi:hypothetical protein